MPRPGQFQKGNQYGKLKAGKKQRKTIIKEQLKELEKITDIEQLKEIVLANWQHLLTLKQNKIKAAATSDVAKYLFVPKKALELSGQVDSKIEVHFNLGATTPEEVKADNTSEQPVLVENSSNLLNSPNLINSPNILNDEYVSNIGKLTLNSQVDAKNVIGDVQNKIGEAK